MIRPLNFVALFFLMISGFGFGFGDDSGKEAIRKEIKVIIEEGYYPGASILLIHKGEAIMGGAYGVVNIEMKEPFTVDHHCWLASTRKIFTETLMAKSADEEVLSFDDPITQTFPRPSEIEPNW